MIHRKTRKPLYALGLAATISTACSGLGSPPRTVAVKPPAELQEAVRAVRRALADGVASRAGVAIAVVRDHELLWSEAHGYADLEQKLPATPETRFRVYSVAKPMTAVAAARLMERGQLDPNAPVHRYVPSFPDKGVAITPMQLAMHTSGIRHYASETEAASLRHCEDISEALEIFADDPLVHPPGEVETYSSWGYVLLSAVVQGVSGEPFDRAMSELVFRPAGMGSPAIDDPTRYVAGRARFYREMRGDLQLAAEVDNTCKWGAGAWLATAADVARFGAAMVDGTLLQPQTLQLFLAGDAEYRAQGLGTGGTAFLSVDSTTRTGVALLANATGESLGPTLQELAAEIHVAVATAHPHP